MRVWLAHLLSFCSCEAQTLLWHQSLCVINCVAPTSKVWSPWLPGPPPWVPCGSVGPAVPSFPPPWCLCPPALMTSHSQVLPSPLLMHEVMAFQPGSSPPVSPVQIFHLTLSLSSNSQVHPPCVWHLLPSLHRQGAPPSSVSFFRETWPSPSLRVVAGGQDERQSWNLVIEGDKVADHHHLLTFKLEDYITSVFYKAVHHLGDM